MASDDLCDMCKTISITSLAYLGYFTHYRSSVFQLEETRTCPLCALIWEALRSDWDRPGIEDLPVRLLLNPPNLAQGPINHLEVVIARHELFETRLWSPGSASPTIPELLIGPPDRYEVPRSQLEISAVLGTPAVDVCKHNNPEVNAGSQNCFLLASQWIEACTKHHICGSPGDVVLPRRVIEVGLGEEGNLPKLFTQPESGIPRRGKYVALSYCWGTKEFLNLTPFISKDFEVGIPTDLLPQTLQDAIVIVRKLGFQFLWVDALCILQGASPEARSDWDVESTKMAEIYSGAHFTILAASSKGAHEGILRRRTTSTSSCRILYRPSGFECDGIVEIGRRPRRSLMKEPLDERAWTYQEFILSKRVLEYGSTELSWKCRHTEWTETNWKPTQAGLESHRLRGDGVPRDWRMIIEQYSPRKLTKATDRLAALAGLKLMFQMHTNDMHAISLKTQAVDRMRILAGLEIIPRMCTNDMYVAGLWRNDLPRHLLWYRSSPNIPRDITGNDGQLVDAPSWSWISVNDGVKFYSPKDITSTFLGVSASKGASFPFVKKASEDGPPIIILKGHIISISSIRYIAHGRYITGLQLGFPWSFLPATLHTFLDDAPSFFKRSQQLETPKHLRNVCFFWIGPSSGLILIPCPQKGNRLSILLSRKEYRRVGMFYGYPVREEKKPVQASMSVIHLI